MSQLWIVGGPNGAGKTTVADRWLAPRIPVVSPDAIALVHGLSPIQAGKEAVREQERLLTTRADFALDTTFSGNREIALMSRAKELGYKINLVFVGIESPEDSMGRILERVASGGHSVPSADVVRRYGRSMENLSIAFDLSDRVLVLDNSGERRRLLLSVEHGRTRHLTNNLPRWAKEAIPDHLQNSRSLVMGR